MRVELLKTLIAWWFKSENSQFFILTIEELLILTAWIPPIEKEQSLISAELFPVTKTDVLLIEINFEFFTIAFDLGLHKIDVKLNVSNTQFEIWEI